MSSQSPVLFQDVARSHRLRDAGVVALWAALVGGFLAHATVPVPGARLAAEPRFAEAAQPREPAVPAVAQGRRAPRAVALTADLGPFGALQPCAAELPAR